MELLVIVIVLSSERLLRLSAAWHWSTLLQRWLLWSQRQARVSGWLTHTPVALLWGLVPAGLISLLVAWLDIGIITFMAHMMLLLMVIACQPLRRLYREFLRASARGEHDLRQQRQADINERVGLELKQPLAQTSVWINYRYYYAPIVAYLVGGPLLMLIYATGRYFDEQFARSSNQRFLPLSWQRLMHVLDWVPVRLASFGLLLVGHFHRAFPLWLELLGQWQLAANTLLSRVAHAAGEGPVSVDDNSSEAVNLLSLAKRNLLLLVCVVALMTIAGWFF